MERRPLVLLSALALGISSLSVASTAAAADGGKPLKTTLTGAAEVPGPGDPDGSGTATIRVKAGKGEVCFTLEVQNIAMATAAHIHIGTVDVAGPVVVGLAPPSTGTSTGCATVSVDLARDIAQHAENYYVNVHNAEYPAGALRGQLG